MSIDLSQQSDAHRHVLDAALGQGVMAEPPDFEQIARNVVGAIIVDINGRIVSEEQYKAALDTARHWLREVWNASGAAIEDRIRAIPRYRQTLPNGGFEKNENGVWLLWRDIKPILDENTEQLN